MDGLLQLRLVNDYYSVLTFQDHAELLKSVQEQLSIVALIEKILDIQTGGTTNLEEALRKGPEELERIRELEGIGILVTDGWVTKGGDPLYVAAKYSRLHVAQVPLGLGGGDTRMCRSLATVGIGIYSYVPDSSQLLGAMTNMIN